MENKLIFLDNASTTRVDPEVLDTYIRVKQEYFANAGSIHLEGQKAARLLEKAREQILNVLGLAKDYDLVFTSGATEANNLAIKGYCLAHQNRGKHIIVSSIEHLAVLEVVRQLEQYFGFEVTYLPVDHNGVIHVEDLKNAIRKDTILVSIMSVNNEVGSINPVKEIGELLKDYPLIAYHCDATQSMGKYDIPYKYADFITFSGHKIHALNSSGALIKRKNIEILPINSGGGQENGLRSGTPDVALAASLAKAMRLTFERREHAYQVVSNLAKMLLDYLKSKPEEYEINSSDQSSYIVNFSLKNKKASVVVECLSNENIMVSSTSACHSKEEPMSYTVKEMGKSEYLAHNTIRVSFCEDTTVEEVKKFISCLDSAVEEIK